MGHNAHLVLTVFKRYGQRQSYDALRALVISATDKEIATFDEFGVGVHFCDVEFCTRCSDGILLMPLSAGRDSDSSGGSTTTDCSSDAQKMGEVGCVSGDKQHLQQEVDAAVFVPGTAYSAASDSDSGRCTTTPGVPVGPGHMFTDERAATTTENEDILCCTGKAGVLLHTSDASSKEEAAAFSAFPQDSAAAAVGDASGHNVSGGGGGMTSHPAPACAVDLSMVVDAHRLDVTPMSPKRGGRAAATAAVALTAGTGLRYGNSGTSNLSSGVGQMGSGDDGGGCRRAGRPSEELIGDSIGGNPWGHAYGAAAGGRVGRGGELGGDGNGDMRDGRPSFAAHQPKQPSSRHPAPFSPTELEHEHQDEKTHQFLDALMWPQPGFDQHALRSTMPLPSAGAESAGAAGAAYSVNDNPRFFSGGLEEASETIITRRDAYGGSNGGLPRGGTASDEGGYGKHHPCHDLQQDEQAMMLAEERNIDVADSCGSGRQDGGDGDMIMGRNVVGGAAGNYRDPNSDDLVGMLLED